MTGIGGTQMHLNAAGNHITPDSVGNDTALFGSPSASGGGRSVVFSRPSYQRGVGHLHGRRGVPDISMSAAVDGAAVVFLDAKVGAGPAGFYLIGGTSEASPLFSGVVAIADQWAGPARVRPRHRRRHRRRGEVRRRLGRLIRPHAGRCDRSRGGRRWACLVSRGGSQTRASVRTGPGSCGEWSPDVALSARPRRTR
ncbi:MAG TPA: hypothetical protein VHS27_10805 [Gaiellales bacterium]|nr:hypothetical protein [Gaiellales bacterium]